VSRRNLLCRHEMQSGQHSSRFGPLVPNLFLYCRHGFAV